ncbi:MAG: hypothetical protein K2Q17_18910 [Nitrospiraceae bacterium]|jgi:hypothetical protein|uniref:hypothetical protein n=1 Tax=Nitrospira cf. moscoviensis SBR1015 TaxID=96242 RepID=UPI00111D81C8|nr:hypothetical protein [Nitrospira cf. moscoviensis SBR1015]MBY0249730.1 hypothetical protein [Nitrospiraceae bacterium]
MPVAVSMSCGCETITMDSYANGPEQSGHAGRDFLLDDGGGFWNIQTLLPHVTDHPHQLNLFTAY